MVRWQSWVMVGALTGLMWMCAYSKVGHRTPFEHLLVWVKHGHPQKSLEAAYDWSCRTVARLVALARDRDSGTKNHLPHKLRPRTAMEEATPVRAAKLERAARSVAQVSKPETSYVRSVSARGAESDDPPADAAVRTPTEERLSARHKQALDAILSAHARP